MYQLKLLAQTPKWLIHIFLWLCLWIALSFLLGNFEYRQLVFERTFLMVLGQALLVYWNIFFLIPRFFFRKQYALYFILALLSVIVVAYGWDNIEGILNWGADRGDGSQLDDARRQLRGNRKDWSMMRWIGRSSTFFLALVISTVYETLGLANQREKETAQMKHEKLETEMKFLRSQINPHFLFNALNNVYALSVIGSDQTPENLLKLSNMLRYMLYEANADLVPLKKELAYLKDYIDLQKLKDSNPLNIEIQLDESQPDLLIPPMILIPFVENSFKHSKIEDLEKGWIKIALTTKDKNLHFQVSNSRPTQSSTKDKVGGIGLQNVEKRLNLLYPNQHQLVIKKEDTQFSIDLKIQLI